MQAVRYVFLGAVWVAAGAGGCADLTQNPEGEYTILLKGFPGPRHVEEAKRYKEETETRTDWRGLYVVHEEHRSQLFWGKYSSIGAAGWNLRRAKRWDAPNQENIYAMAIVVRISGADIGPAEWNLRNAKGKYTVLVARYYNMPRELLAPAYTRRKEDAVEYCKELRAEGVEAYFLHGPSKSYVTIGTFDESAVVSVQRGMQFVREIRDPRMHAVIRDHPKLAVNGREEWTWVINPKTGEKEKIISKSYPMEMPRSEEDAFEVPEYRPGYEEPGQAP